MKAAEAVSVVAAAGSEVLAPVATGDDDRFTGAVAVAFAAQADLAARAIDWYRHYVSLLRRLSSGHTPVAIVSYCGQGSTTEGVRRAGGSAHGYDFGDQPRYVGPSREHPRRSRMDHLHAGRPDEVYGQRPAHEGPLRR